MNMSFSGGALASGCALNLCDELDTIIRERRLTPVFQPIVDLQAGTVLGYEGLIRGPSDSALHSPVNLFDQAARCGRDVWLDQTCRRVTMESFVEHALPGWLFLNVNPGSLLAPDHRPGETLAHLKQIGLDPQRIIIELTETLPFSSYDALREATDHYRENGFRIALDDLGEGYSNLRLWSELRPDFVKLDKHFVQDIHRDPLKEQFVRSMVDIARQSGAQLVAEGIESAAELRILRNLGVQYGQGYLIARPRSVPVIDVRAAIDGVVWSQDKPRPLARQQPVARDLLVEVPALDVRDNNETAYQIFIRNHDCMAIPVLEGRVPVGLLRRHDFLECFARPFNRELYAKKSCRMLMDKNPLIVSGETGIQELSSLVVASGKRYLADGFILTEGGVYLGMGTCYDLMRKISELQICAARYANPLTGLPGNVPINEAIDRLLGSGQPFIVAYVDLDHFKPFNDVYGYAAGDELIELIARLLMDVAEPECDFLGHVGGDDFVLLMQSQDWEKRLSETLTQFDQRVRAYFSPEHAEAGGFTVPDRCGTMSFFPLTSVSIGVLRVSPGQYRGYLDIATATVEAKKMAKKQAGSSLFVERRQPVAVPLVA
jgi:diguanylate cyclase (GGDEF)-like protein